MPGAAAETTSADADALSAAVLRAHEDCLASPNRIRVSVVGLASDKGIITADLHNEEPEHFLKGRHRLDRTHAFAKGETVELCFVAPEPGDYSIVLYQDENLNRKFDKNFLGIPIEPFGVSNNPDLSFGPPSVEEALFAVPAEGTDIEIVLMRYGATGTAPAAQRR